MSVYIDIEKKIGSFLLKVKLEAGEETLALLGASGCGKTMTLKCIAGIEKPDRGTIVVDGVTVFDSERRINLSPQKRRIGFLFQNYALFPNMTVLQNLKAAAGREKNKALRNDRITQIINSFGLKELLDRMPRTLSGGQQQRVALARILVSEPNILLLDEPFSALDSHLRLTLEREVRQVIRQFGKTVILVSHDRNEVYRMSDRMAIMDEGSVAEYGSKSQVFHHPTSLCGARMVGCENIIKADQALFLGNRESIPTPYVGFTASDLGADEDGTEFRITELIQQPKETVLQLQAIESDCSLLWSIPSSAAYSIGETVKIRIPREKMLFLNDGSEREEV